MSFPPHRSYRPSGMPWIGEIPLHWDVKRIKETTYVKGRVGWKGLTSDEFMDAGYAHLITGTDFRSKFIDWSECYYVDRQRYEDDPFIQLRDGDLLITKDGTIGKLAIVTGLTQPACLNSGIFLVRPITSYRTEFLYWLLSSRVFSTFCDLTSYGSTIQRLYQNVFENFLFPVPPLSEQAAIASFLDRETAKIDALVEEQKRLIDLLREKRQAVISHAVTKGLKPDAPMKDSGVEWLGQVPEHWKVTKLGRYVSILSGFAFPSSGFSHDTEDTRLLRGINVGVGSIKWDEAVYWRREANDGLDRFLLAEGQIVVGMDRPWISEGVRVARVSHDDLPCLLLQRVSSVTMLPGMIDEFAYALLSSELFIRYFTPDTTGVSVPHISPEQISRFVVPVPPLEEQRAIVAFIDQQTDATEALLNETTAALTLLQERRSALISAAVTGKINVRGEESAEMVAA